MNKCINGIQFIRNYGTKTKGTGNFTWRKKPMWTPREQHSSKNILPYSQLTKPTLRRSWLTNSPFMAGSFSKFGCLSQLWYGYCEGYYYFFKLIIFANHFTCTASFNSRGEELILNMGGNWGLQKLRNLPRVSELAGGRANIHLEYCPTLEAEL